MVGSISGAETALAVAYEPITSISPLGPSLNLMLVIGPDASVTPKNAEPGLPPDNLTGAMDNPLSKMAPAPECCSAIYPSFLKTGCFALPYAYEFR